MGRAVAEIAVTVRVSGRVQGVWFRGWTQEQATARGLRGWVRNRPDGDVEGLIAGPEQQVHALIAALHEGPSAAQVRGVDWAETVAYGGTGFEIRR